MLFNHSQRKSHIIWWKFCFYRPTAEYPTSIHPNKVLLQKISLSHSSQLSLSLSARFLSASISAVCFNSSKMFMIEAQPSSMGSSQKMMKLMSSFNTRTVPVERYFDKFWLKALVFSNNEPLLRCFSRA